MYTCAMCGGIPCKRGELENAPSNCPCNETEEQDAVKALYFEDENYNLAYNAALVESEGYCTKTRLEETMDFAHKCNFKTLGVAFCSGLRKEARMLCAVLTHNGFDVYSVVCKNGSIPKEHLKLTENEKIKPGTFEPMCNPIGQAHFLNSVPTDFNIILGLCVGHDSLFIKHANAPVTVLAAKDRVLAHNPMGALYLSQGYYRKKLFK